MVNAKGQLAEAYTDPSMTTDLGFSYSVRGETTDVYQKTSGTYHLNCGAGKWNQIFRPSTTAATTSGT